MEKMMFKRNLNFTEQKWVFRKSRLKHYVKFIKTVNSKNVILFGHERFDDELLKLLEYNGNVIDVKGNYNESILIPNTEDSTYFCFEILEHLLNPLLFQF